MDTKLPNRRLFVCVFFSCGTLHSTDTFNLIQVTKTVTLTAVLKGELLPMGLVEKRFLFIFIFFGTNFGTYANTNWILIPISWVWLPAETAKTRFSVFSTLVPTHQVPVSRSKAQHAQRSLRTLKIPCPPSDKRRPNGRWHGNIQIRRNSSRIVKKLMTVHATSLS